MDLCLIIKAGEIAIPDFHDEILFYHFKQAVLSILKNSEIYYFGYAPDNTADNQDDLLFDGKLFRVISPENLIDVNIESDKKDVIEAFRSLIENKNPFWSSVIIEKGFINVETTVEFKYL